MDIMKMVGLAKHRVVMTTRALCCFTCREHSCDVVSCDVKLDVLGALHSSVVVSMCRIVVAWLPEA